MKTITVKNLTIQFDTFDDGADRHNATNMIEVINEVLQVELPNTHPQIIAIDAIVDEDIEIV